MRVLKHVAPDEWPRVRLLADFAYPFGPDGLRAGDVIEAIDGRPVRSWKAFFEGYGRVGSRPIEITVRRDGARVVVRLAPAAR